MITQPLAAPHQAVPPPPVLPSAASSSPPPPAAASAVGNSKVVIAVNDYNAGKDNELSFMKGDRITQVEVVSDGWYSGKDQHGNVGLFPVNYVNA